VGGGDGGGELEFEQDILLYVPWSLKQVKTGSVLVEKGVPEQFDVPKYTLAEACVELQEMGSIEPLTPPCEISRHTFTS
jgi:hypothetical protein